MARRPRLLAVLLLLVALAGCATPPGPEEDVSTLSSSSSASSPAWSSTPSSTTPSTPYLSSSPSPPKQPANLRLEASAVRVGNGYRLESTLTNDGPGDYESYGWCSPPGWWGDTFSGPGGIEVRRSSQCAVAGQCMVGHPCVQGSILPAGESWTRTAWFNGTTGTHGGTLLPEGDYVWNLTIARLSSEIPLVVDWTSRQSVDVQDLPGAFGQFPGLFADATLTETSSGLRLDVTFTNRGDRTYAWQGDCIAIVLWDDNDTVRDYGPRCPLPAGSTFRPGDTMSASSTWNGTLAPPPEGISPRHPNFPNLYTWEVRLRLHDAAAPEGTGDASASLRFGLARPASGQ